MPLSLRKACHACVIAKRKCIPQLPACERCTQKQIQCKYDLEPIVSSDVDQPRSTGITESNGEMQQFRLVYDSVPNARDASASAMASGLGSESSAAHPLLMADGETTIWLMRWFTQAALDGTDGRMSPFVHSRVADKVESSSQGHKHLSSSLSRSTLSELTEIHQLINTALQRLLLDKPSVRRDAETEAIVQRLFSVTHALWSTADTLELRSVRSWDAWFVAESIRRSMFAAVFVRGIWSVVSSGFCHYEPFLESMPFDPRAGLWEADTEEAWSALVTQKHRGEHTHLKSWREFTENPNNKQLSVDEDGQFQRMLYVSFHGSDGIRWLHELDNQRNGKLP